MNWIILLVLILLCYILYKLQITETKKTILFWIIIIIVFLLYFIYEEKTAIKDGEIYYVNLFNKLESSKNYRVTGLIGVDEYGYHLLEVYWPDGDELSFENNSHQIDLIVGQKVEIEDDNGKNWFVELTDDKYSSHE